MKLGYSTYAMKSVDVFEALPRIREIGYDAVEIMVADEWPTSPDRLDANARTRLRSLIEDQGFPPPILFGPVDTCASADERPAMLERFSEFCTLAGDLNFGAEPSVITTTLGGKRLDWAAGREQIADCLTELADMAAGMNTIVAIEPHVGNPLDSPDKAAWLMKYTNHAHLKLNFDYSHFWVQGMDLERSAELCLPDAVHIHIKDGVMEDGKVKFLLPSDGDLNLEAYMKLLCDADVRVPVTAEVSGMVSKAPGYDPWESATFCYQALNDARP